MISIAWASGVITIPQSFLTLLGGTTYELDLDVFRLALKDLEDDEAGMPWPKTHNHDTETTLAGITFARKITILYPYTVVFENGSYGVICVGANSNVADVLVRNSVSVNTQNSAGLIVKNVGSGLSSAQDTKLTETHERATQTNQAITLASGLVVAGSTANLIHTDIVRDTHSQIGLTLVIVSPGSVPVARSIRAHANGGIYEVLLPLVVLPEEGDLVFITSFWRPVRGTVR